MTGSPLQVSLLPELTAHRGKLLSRQSERGKAVHAACYIRERRIVFETDLLRRRRVLNLIVIHEIFHFVWARLGNERRADFAGLLLSELRESARGELGESSAVQKNLLMPLVPVTSRSWRDYVCESFCDTAAWVYSGVRSDTNFTLANRWSARRAAWFAAYISSGCRF